ncbi:hypothetical protein ABK040_005339 [Willaertia magna]
MEENDKQELADFLDSLEDFTPAIPDQVISYYLQQSGFKTGDTRVLRLISLAAQKFISEVCTDSMHFCEKRTGGKQQGKERRLVLSTEDLSNSLREYGINIHKPEYFSDSLVNEQISTNRATSSSTNNPNIAQTGNNPNTTTTNNVQSPTNE